MVRFSSAASPNWKWGFLCGVLDLGVDPDDDAVSLGREQLHSGLHQQSNFIYNKLFAAAEHQLLLNTVEKATISLRHISTPQSSVLTLKTRSREYPINKSSPRTPQERHHASTIPRQRAQPATLPLLLRPPRPKRLCQRRTSPYELAVQAQEDGHPGLDELVVELLPESRSEGRYERGELVYSGRGDIVEVYVGVERGQGADLKICGCWREGFEKLDEGCVCYRHEWLASIDPLNGISSLSRLG